MNTKIFSMFGATIFGWVGWWLGAKVGMMTGFFVSMLGTGFGIYLARRLVRDYLG